MKEMKSHRQAFLDFAQSFAAHLSPGGSLEPQALASLAERPAIAIALRSDASVLRLLHRADDRTGHLAVLECVLHRPDPAREATLLRDLLTANALARPYGTARYAMDPDGCLVYMQPFALRDCRVEDLVATVGMAWRIGDALGARPLPKLNRARASVLSLYA